MGFFFLIPPLPFGFAFRDADCGLVGDIGCRLATRARSIEDVKY